MVQVNWIVATFLFSILSGVGFFYFLRLMKGTDENQMPSKMASEDDERELKKLFDKIENLITTNQYYLNKNLKLADLASELNVQERMISRAVNKHGNGNINKFINSFRVNYSKELLSSGKYDHYTIEAIAEEAGFSNKVSFYTAFKSETGMSPSQFRALKQSNF